MDAICKLLLCSALIALYAVTSFGSNKYVRICSTAYLLIVLFVLCYLALRYLFQRPSEGNGSSRQPDESPDRRRPSERRRPPEPRCATPPYEVREKSPIPIPTGRPLEGYSFSLSGSMLFKRDNMIALITYFGGTYHRTPRRGTDYLVTTEEDTDKVVQARRNHVTVISPDELFRMMGTNADDLCQLLRCGDFLSALGLAMKPHRERRELHSYERLAEQYVRELRDALCPVGEITLPHPIQVVARDDEGSMEVYRVDRLQRTPVGESVLLAVDGEAVYLQDLIEHSIVELRKAIAI